VLLFLLLLFVEVLLLWSQFVVFVTVDSSSMLFQKNSSTCTVAEKIWRFFDTFEKNSSTCTVSENIWEFFDAFSKKLFYVPGTCTGTSLEEVETLLTRLNQDSSGTRS
jgi:hypothetical protein